jgi:hypothetical protein
VVPTADTEPITSRSVGAERSQGAERPASRPAVTPRRFQPLLTIGNQQALLSLIEDVAGSELRQQLLRVGEEIDRAESLRAELTALGLSGTDVVPTLSYLAVLRVLRDLLLQGWTLGMDEEGVYLIPPLVGALQLGPDELKAALRESFAFARRAQLSDPATAQFVRDMERRGIGAVLADGAELAERLSRVATAEELERAVRPSLELVSPDARDDSKDGTGLRLQDIWRYARHFWSIPYQSAPGRNLFYLVRDDAGPRRPVMGIAALGNPLIRLTQRDDQLGWTRDSLRRRLEASNTADRLAIGQHLARVAHEGINDIYRRDLDLDGRSEKEAAAYLLEVEKEAARRRDLDLSKAGAGRTVEYALIRDAHTAVHAGRGEDVDWERLATTALYRRKRAGTLADLLRATATLRERGADRDPDAVLRILRGAHDGRPDEAGEHAVEIVLRRIKQKALAEHVLELITCGAVPPYGEILGGKLVAMLMASPRVVADVRRRYEGRISLIASAMKGSPVRREPRLAYLTTSSLYSAGSTQYDGVRVPGETGTIGFRRLGVTESYGTVQFAQDTAADLTQIAWRSDPRNRRLVNHLFGEGMSPKLRAMRSGLDALGLSSDTFLRHHSPRVLYGAALCRNVEDVLLGVSEQPDYILSGSEDPSPIVAHWRSRWVQPRIERPETIQRLRGAHRNTLFIGEDLPDPLVGTPPPTQQAPAAQQPAAVPTGGPGIAFVERVYRSVNSYADRLSAEELGWMHIDLGLDEAILGAAEKNNQIIITGNPGDGKTHLIERLRPDLERLGAEVITDANALSDEEILEKWRRCAAEGWPLVVAINEWPLFALHRQDRAFAPLQEALRQVREAVYYLEPPAPPRDPVQVVDLSLRNILAPHTARAAVERLTHERFYEGLHVADPASANRAALRHPRVQERLVRLLDRIARHEGHTTMRQLMGFVAFLITGGVTSTGRIASQGSDRFHYATLAFEGGAGGLFGRLRAAFDPCTVTHPMYDMALWRGVTDPTAWLDGDIAALGPQQIPEAGRLAAYRALKRRFYFEHAAGAELLDALPTDEREFEEIVAKGQSDNHALVREVLLALNRFFEPGCPPEQREELILWQSHRFDVRAPDTFVALRRVPHHFFRIEPPKLAPWVTAWLPADQWLPRTFALVASSVRGDVAAQLLVDRELFLSLRDAQRGLGRATWSRSAARKITRFVDRLHHIAETESPVEDVRVRNTGVDLDRKFEIQRTPARYLL